MDPLRQQISELKILFVVDSKHLTFFCFRHRSFLSTVNASKSCLTGFNASDSLLTRFCGPVRSDGSMANEGVGRSERIHGDITKL